MTLPDGAWYDFWKGTRFDGPAKVEVDAPLETIPLFVREGSLIPLEEMSRISLHFYARSEGKSNRSFYFDAGDAYGPSRVDRFETSRRRDTLTILWKKEGDFPFPYDQVFVEALGIENNRAFVDGKTVVWNQKRLDTGMFDELRIES